MIKFSEWAEKRANPITEAENPFKSWDTRNYRMWELSQATVEELIDWKKRAEAKLAYLEKTSAIQRQNNLNDPKKQIEMERKSKAPHEQIISDVEAELARRN